MRGEVLIPLEPRRCNFTLRILGITVKVPAQRREMIRTAFLIGAAVLALGSACPARAQTLYLCVLDGQVAGPDQLVSVEIAIKPNGEFASIIYRAANGAAYDRSKQFDWKNSQDGNGQYYWTGTLRTNPNVAIAGSLSRKGDRLAYSETFSDKVQGSAQITSTCEPIVPSPQVSFPKTEFNAVLAMRNRLRS